MEAATVDRALDSAEAPTRDQARAVFAHVMGLVALTVGCVALGAYIGRDLGGGEGIAFFIGSIACVIGLSVASARGKEQLAAGLLFGLGLTLGLAVGPLLSAVAQADPAALWRAAGVTAAVVAALGSYAYATRSDLSSWGRTLFWALVGLITFGIVTLLIEIPNGNVIYAVLGLVIFGGWTIYDFNRLRRSDVEDAVPIAASIFLDIFNVFLLALNLFGSSE